MGISLLTKTNTTIVFTAIDCGYVFLPRDKYPAWAEFARFFHFFSHFFHFFRTFGVFGTRYPKSVHALRVKYDFLQHARETDRTQGI